VDQQRECAYRYCTRVLTGRADQRYCTTAHRVAAHREQHSDSRESSGERRLCDWCGEWIPYPRALNPNARYCNWAHKQAYYRMCGGPPIPADVLAGFVEAFADAG